jgi:hypothetical protein
MKDSWGVKDVELPENIYKLTGLKTTFPSLLIMVISSHDFLLFKRKYGQSI